MSGLDELTRAARRARAERPLVPLALATLHAVDGSSYRQPGARLLVDADGRVLAGAVSGGCLEGDVAAQAAAVCASGVPRRLTYDLRDDLQAIWGFGAMCDGVAHLLLEPLGDLSWLERACAIRDAREEGALITVLEETAAGGTGEWHACALRFAMPPSL
ncbi:MAG: XdhC family protein [Gemmatimonadaceae bacterium]|nr:XdhC family protein [Gemmatimonadaceae bacterium]